MAEDSDPNGFVPENEPVSPNAATRLEAFAGQLARKEGESPADAARRRGWVDETGQPTAEGRELLKALDEQRQTRSALRGLS